MINLLKNIFLSKGNTTVVKPSNEPIYNRLVRIRYPRIEAEISNLKRYIDMAMNIDYPNRLYLYQYYNEAMSDAHLHAQIRTAIYTIQQSKFQIVDDKENEVPELHSLFENSWFSNYLKYAIESEFYGHSLIEFGKLNNGLFDEIILIPRENVASEFGMIKINPNDDPKRGIPYRDMIQELYLQEIGMPNDLGLLAIASKYTTYKNYSLADWSRASEKYGMPILAINASSKNPRELDAIEEMARNIGSNGYVILDANDKIDLKMQTAPDGYFKGYLEMMINCDAQISKLINGQTMTQDDSSSYAQANVHERILNNYTRARLAKLQNIINSSLFPFLSYHGYKLEGKQFRFYDIVSYYADKPQEESEPISSKQTYKKKKPLDLLYRT